MSKEKGVSAGIVVIATLVGGILGTAAGLLFAPQSGKETRKKLGEKYKVTAETVNNTLNNVDEKVSQLVTKVTSEVKAAVPEQVKTQIARISDEVEDTFNKTIAKGSSYLADLKETVDNSLQAGKKKFIEKKRNS